MPDDPTRATDAGRGDGPRPGRHTSGEQPPFGHDRASRDPADGFGGPGGFAGDILGLGGPNPPDDETDTDSAGRDVEQELTTAQAEAERHLNDLRRLKADFENYRKRILREQSNIIASASQSLVTRLLPVMDQFDMALSAAENSRDFDRMLKGVEMIAGELRDILRNEGLQEISAEGEQFDPKRHEAVITVEADEVESGTVVGVVRAGYELQGRVIRPATVKVAQ